MAVMKKFHSGESYGEHSFKSSITVKGVKHPVLPKGTIIYQQGDNTPGRCSRQLPRGWPSESHPWFYRSR
jgi:hypothetical protein